MDLITTSFLMGGSKERGQRVGQEGGGVIIEKIFYCFISCFGPFAALFFTLKKLIILAAGGYLPTVGEHIAPISLRGINLKMELVLQAPCKVLQGVPTENISKEK